MPKEKLIATKGLTYATRRLQAGDAFEAVSRDARVLKAIGKARVDHDAPVKAALAETKTEAPEPDLDALRVEAEAAGIKVDRRWGEARLRQEIAAAVKLPDHPEPARAMMTDSALVPPVYRYREEA